MPTGAWTVLGGGEGVLGGLIVLRRRDQCDRLTPVDARQGSFPSWAFGFLCGLAIRTFLLSAIANRVRTSGADWRQACFRVGLIDVGVAMLSVLLWAGVPRTGWLKGCLFANFLAETGWAVFSFTAE